MAGVRVDEKLSDAACRFETFLELLERRIRNPVILCELRWFVRHGECPVHADREETPLG